MARKKLATGLMIPALTTSGAWAADEDEGASFGFVAGRTFSGLSPLPGYATYYASRSLPGVAIGVGAAFPMRGAKYLQPELYYTKFGARFGNNHLTYEHLAMPILFRFDFAEAEPITPFVMLGPQVSFQLRSAAHFESIVYSYSYSLRGYAYGPFGLPFDAGATVGAGFTIPVKNVSLQASMRLYHGVYPHAVPLQGVGWNRQVGVFGGLYF